MLGLFVMLGAIGYVFAADQASDKNSMMIDQGSMMQSNVAENNKAVEVGNKICPVSGEKVGQMGEIVKYEYNGKIYNLCCEMCLKDFKKDPEKYSKIAEEEMAKEKESK
jgi:YHS domain-containing protein